VVEPLGPATSREVAKGPGQLMAIFVGILIFGAWCLAALVTRRTVARWSDLERFESALAAEAAAELGHPDDERDQPDERQRPEDDDGQRSDEDDRAEMRDLWLTPSTQPRARAGRAPR
jgi:hypothetical protein